MTQSKILKLCKEAILDLFLRTEKIRIAAGFEPLLPTKVKAAKTPKRKYRIVAENDLPEYMIGHKELKGVCVGACIYNERWSKKVPHSAHAHTGKVGKYAGWICFENEKAFTKRTTCLHELAHIVSNSGHTIRWATKYVALAGGEPKWLTIDWLQAKYNFKTAKKKNEAK
jgi:hypothetical protein